MDKLFEVLFLGEAVDFLSAIDKKHSEKILYNIRKSQIEQDAELLKKITDEIWEFRTLFQGNQYRLLAFWDKKSKENTLVVATHGFIKKRSKIAGNEISKAEKSRAEYFNEKEESNKKKK